MNKTFLNILLWVIFSFLNKVEAQNPTLKPSELFGTWRATYSTGNYAWSTEKEFYFTLYEDFRSLTIDGFIIKNGFWKTDDNLLIVQDSDGTMSSLFTTYFNKDNWIYKGLGSNTTYTAVKISNIPVYIPQKDYTGNDKELFEAESNVISIDKIYGTWKSTNLKTKDVFYFNLYPDQRIYNVGNGAVTGNWTIIGDKFYFYVDYVSEPYITKTTSFSLTSWVYESLQDEAKYSATKISTTPQSLKLQPKKASPQSAQSKQQQSSNSATKPVTHYSKSSSFGCMACNGTCQENCSICYGEGRIKERVTRERYNSATDRYELEYDYEWRNCTAGCNYGKIQCTACKCKSTDATETLYNYSKQVPYDEYLIGSWQASTGEKYTFYSQTTSDGYLLSVGSYVGSWEIEDSLLKMFLHQGLDPKWNKYTFDSFDNNTLVLRSTDGYLSKITLKRL